MLSPKTTWAVFALLPLVSAQLFPAYKLVSEKKGPSDLSADIASSSFVGVDGQYHFLTSAADYEQSNSGGSFVNTYTSDNLGTLWNSPSHPPTNANTYWNNPGTFCYQVDKRANKPMPSLYQDDHCDVIGIWVDPATKNWIGIVNDEYQFNPWNFNQTQNARIATGRHNNRIMLAQSSDQGATWELVDQLFTSHYQPQQTITPALFPNTTYCWGLSGCRFYVDQVTGYAYGIYNHQIRYKTGDATFVQHMSMARAPLSGGLAPETWRKYYKGRWDQPGIGGMEDPIQEPLGFSVTYDPLTDYVAYEGTGADGSAVAYQSERVAGGIWYFKDAAGVRYRVVPGTTPMINNADTYQIVPSVQYKDPALDRTIWVGPNAANKIVINSTDNAGHTTTWDVAKTQTVFKEKTSERLYVLPAPLTQMAFSFNVQSGKYRGASYDLSVAAIDDLGKPNAYTIVGEEDRRVSAHSAYMTTIDTGSLTSQRISSVTYGKVSDLGPYVDVISVTPPSSSQSQFSADVVYKDTNGQPLTQKGEYHVSVGWQRLKLSAPDKWTIEPITDTFDASHPTGFFRLKTGGGYLRVAAGNSPAAERAWGAKVALSPAALPEYDPSGNGGYGTPGGSDQWFLLPIGGNTPTVLNPDSPDNVVQAAQKTSLKDAVGYKLVNRNSDLVLAFVDGGWQTVPNEFAKNKDQQVVFELIGNPK